MQFFTIATAFFLAATASAQGSTCFDDTDCFLFAGGGHCVKPSGGFLGTCDSATTIAPTSTKGKGHTTTSTPAPIPTSGSICFDDGDCFFAGGNCVKGSGAITGFCVPSTTSASSGGSGGFKEFRA